MSDNLVERLRAFAVTRTDTDRDIRALIAELEKARGYVRDVLEERQVNFLLYNTAVTERNAARALLREALPWVGHMSDDPSLGLRARIAAFLGEAT